MTRRRLVGIVVVAFGVGLLVVGARSADSLAAEVTRFLAGASPDRSVWLALGGIAAIVRGSMVVAMPSDGGRVALRD